MITIGKLSQETGVKIETIRFYEKEGLMPKPSRKASGHRIYNLSQVKQLGFIKRGRELGFSLADIRELIGAENNPPSCNDVFTLTDRHLASIKAKIIDLRKLEKRLSLIAKECRQNDDPCCPIIDALSE